MNVFQSLTGSKTAPPRPQVRQYIPANKSGSKTRPITATVDTPLQIFHRRIREIKRDTPNSLDYNRDIKLILGKISDLFSKSTSLRGDESNDDLSAILNGLLDEIGVPNKAPEVANFNAVSRLLEVTDPIFFKIF